MELRTPLRNNGILSWTISFMVPFAAVIYFSDRRIIFAILMTIIILLVMLFRLYETFTTVVRIHKDQVEIEYTQLFKKKLISIPIAAATLSLKVKTVGRSRSSKYSLHFYEKGIRRHRISEDEGYSKKDFAAFIHAFTAAAQSL